ncbi:TIGR03943 family putative permease subunit [Streptomyces sp. NPDC093261]|uniref:TIGR03943 family putative permease subunit n=1 Tax=Streptomyces sp. NPDC093261 TaxID=3366037 RepID=UPI00381BDAEC
MKRPVQVTLLVLSGLGLLHASLFTDLCLRYVKEGLRPMLIASGVLLLVLGLVDAASGSRSRPAHGEPSGRPEGDSRDDYGVDGDGRYGVDGDGRNGLDAGGPGQGHDGHRHAGHPHEARRHRGHDGSGHGDNGDTADSGHGHGHDHSGAPRVAWLLFLPALSLLFFAPPALGAYTAAREAPKTVKEQQHFDPLPRTSPVPMTLTDFTTRVQQDRGQAIKGRSIRMTGFVTPDKRSGSWYLTRIIISCCAADAQSVKVRVYGKPALAANTWVAVTGTWHPGGTLGTSSAPVALDAHTVERITRPVNGYTDDLPLTPSR